MKITARKDFDSPVTGNVKTGQVIETDRKVASRLIAHGYCEPYKTKVINEAPIIGADNEYHTKEDSNDSGKRGRKRKKKADE